MFTNWRSAYNYCNRILQGINKKKKVKTVTKNKDLRCTKPLNDRFKKGLVTDYTLKHNSLCEFVDEKPLDDESTTIYPSKRKGDKKSIIEDQNTAFVPPLINSPSPPLLLFTIPPLFPSEFRTLSIPLFIPTIIHPIAHLQPPSVQIPHSKQSSSVQPPIPLEEAPPSIYIKMKRDKHYEQKEKSRKWDRIVEFTKRKRSVFTRNSARRLIVIALNFAPMMSLVAATRFISLIYCAILKELGVNVSPQEIANVAPSHNCVRNIMSDAATETLCVARSKTHKKLSCSCQWMQPTRIEHTT